MTDTLFDITYRVCTKLGMVREGVATGGDATTIIDTVERNEEDNYWVKGTAWLLRNANDVGVSPENKYSVITVFVNSTGVITLRDTFTDNVEVGDRYALGKRRYPLWLLTQKTNEAVEGMGEIPVVDKATITTAASQTEYDLPIAANRNLLNVYIQTSTDTNAYGWHKIFGWTVERTAVGTADLLMLPYQPPTGKLLLLEFGDVHVQLYNSTDQLSETVHIQRVVVLAAIKCLLHRKQKIGSNDPTLNEQLNMFMNELQLWEAEEPIRKPKKTPKYMIVGGRTKKDAFFTPDPP
jgi:hypothetical protein